MSQVVDVPTKIGTVIVNEAGDPCLMLIGFRENGSWAALSEDIEYVTDAQVSRLLTTGFRAVTPRDVNCDE